MADINKLPAVERAARFADLRDRVQAHVPIASSGITGRDRLDMPHNHGGFGSRERL